MSTIQSLDELSNCVWDLRAQTEECNRLLRDFHVVIEQGRTVNHEAAYRDKVHRLAERVQHVTESLAAAARATVEAAHRV